MRGHCRVKAIEYMGFIEGRPDRPIRVRVRVRARGLLGIGVQIHQHDTQGQRKNAESFDLPYLRITHHLYGLGLWLGLVGGQLRVRVRIRVRFSHAHVWIRVRGVRVRVRVRVREG